MENDNRIDAFKVRRKIFERYPEGSPERKVILKEAKMMEFKYASKAMRLLPKETYNMLADANRRVIVKETSTVLVLGVVVAGLISLQIRYFTALTPLQVMGATGGIVHLTSEIISAILRLKRVVEAFQIVKAEYERMRDKMDKIVTDMDGL